MSPISLHDENWTNKSDCKNIFLWIKKFASVIKKILLRFYWKFVTVFSIKPHCWGCWRASSLSESLNKSIITSLNGSTDKSVFFSPYQKLARVSQSVPKHLRCATVFLTKVTQTSSFYTDTQIQKPNYFSKLSFQSPLIYNINVIYFILFSSRFQ